MLRLALLVPAAFGSFLALGVMGKKVSADRSKKEVSDATGFSSLEALEYLSEAASGLFFALGLAVSGRACGHFDVQSMCSKGGHICLFVVLQLFAAQGPQYLLLWYNTHT